MLIVSPSIPRKIVGIEKSVKRQDIVSFVSVEAADKDTGSLYRINKLSHKVCVRPCSATNKASSIFPILSKDQHKALYVFSCSSRNLIFQLSSDFKRDLKELKVSIGKQNYPRRFRIVQEKNIGFQRCDRQVLLQPDHRFLLQLSNLFHDN